MSLNKKIINPQGHIKDLENIINDLILIVALNNSNDPIINKAYRLIGTPINMVEMRVAITQPERGLKYVTQ